MGVEFLIRGLFFCGFTGAKRGILEKSDVFRKIVVYFECENSDNNSMVTWLNNQINITNKPASSLNPFSRVTDCAGGAFYTKGQIMDNEDREAYQSISNSVWYRAWKAVKEVYPHRRKMKSFHLLVGAFENKDRQALQQYLKRFNLTGFGISEAFEKFVTTEKLAETRKRIKLLYK